MSHLAKPPIQGLELFLAEDFTCRELPGRRRSLELVIKFGEAGFTDAVYGELLRHGFYRDTTPALFRCHCDGCSACVQVRVVVDEFVPNRSQSRSYKRNYDELAWRIMPPEFSEEHYKLYCRYQAARHADCAASRERYKQLLGSPVTSLLFEYKEGQRLMAVSLADVVEQKAGTTAAHGLVASYIFYEPEELKRGLGTFAMTDMIMRCSKWGIPYIYLYRWVAENPKLAYKTSFQPLEGFIDEQWQRIGKDGLVVPHNTSACPLKLSENPALPFAQHF